MKIQQVGNQTPSATDVILSAIRSQMLDLYTFMPATVVEYDALLQTCTVQPAFKATYIDPPVSESLPQIFDVPVIFNRSSSRGAQFPLSKGDGVGLVFSQRSLDDWFTKGGEVLLTSARTHDISDAVALPGLFSQQGVLSGLKDAYQIFSDKIWIGDPEGTPDPASTLSEVELVQAVSKIIEKILEKPLVSSMGPVNFDPTVVTTLAGVQTTLDGLVP